jgi:hypothetical protein
MTTRTTAIDLSEFDTETCQNDGSYAYVPPDWVKMARMVRVVTLRMFAGSIPDKWGTKNLSGALAAGLIVIPYQWLYLSPGTLVNQVHTFRTWLDQTPGGAQFTPLLDFEDYGRYTGWRWMASEVANCTALLDRGDIKALQYFSPSFIQSYFRASDAPFSAGRKYLIAHWDASAPTIRNPLLRADMAGWQYTGSADARAFGIVNGNAVCSLYDLYP